MPRTVHFSSFTVFTFILFTTVLSFGQMTNVTGDQAPPVPGAGHDYIQFLAETVNPATGALSIRIHTPVIPGRGITVPFAFGYDSNAAYHLLGPGGWGTNLGVLANSGWSYVVPQLSVVQQTVTPPNQPPPPVTCYYYTDYIFSDLQSASHSLGLSAVQGNFTTACGGVPARFNSLTGGDMQVQATTTPADSSGFPRSSKPSPVTVTDRDGTVYYFSNFNGGVYPAFSAVPDWIETRNGNKITFSQSNGSITISDSVGRSSLVLAGFGATGNTVTVSGLSNSYQLTWGRTNAPAAINAVITTALPPGSNNPCQQPSGSTQGLSAVTAIQLPNGQSYTFTYDSNTGLVSRITYPTGAYVRYVWGVNALSEVMLYPAEKDTNPNSSDCQAKYDTSAVATRYVSFDGVHEVLRQDFSYSTTWAPNSFPTNDHWTSKQTTVLTHDLIQGIDSKVAYSYGPAFVAFQPNDPVRLGTNSFPVETSVASYDSNDALLRTVNKSYADPLLPPDESIVLENNLTSQVHNVYQNGLLQDKFEYDFGASAPGALLRHTHTDYATFATTPSGGSISDRPSDVITYDGAGSRIAETDYAYDQTSLAPVTASAHDDTGYPASFTVRGNATTVTKKCFVPATGQNCPDAITTLTYDQAGQVITQKDPNGNTTTYSYVDSFTDTPPAGNTNAYVTQITHPQTGTVAHIENFSYAYSDGQVTVAKDQNGQKAKFFYNDSLRRLTEDDSPDGEVATLAYNDSTPLGVTSTKKLDSNANIQSTLVTDGMGHTVQTQLNSDPSGVDYVDTSYDGRGQSISVSNPHRSVSASTDGVTFKQYDALGRLTQTTMQDGSAIRLSYAGNCVTTTDETGKPRKGCSDALGRLIEVDEPNAASTGTNATASVVISGSLLTSNSVVDSGTVSLTSGGFTATACYGISTNSSCANMPVSNTAAQVASALASKLNVPGSPISATTSGSTLSLVWKTPGPFFPGVAALATTHDRPSLFANPSFSGPATMFDHGTGPSLNANPYVTLYQYDALGNLLCVEQHGAVTGTGCSADASQGPTSPWRVRRFTYDSLSRLLTASNPESGTITKYGTTTYFYDANGNLLQKVSPTPNLTGTDQHTISYCYDALNRVSGKAYSWQNCQNGQLPQGTAVVTYSYDSGTNGIGRLTSLTDQAGSASYSYDVMGRIVGESRTIHGAHNDITKNLSYTYNLDGSVKTLTYPSGATITYATDSAERMVSAVDNNNIKYVSGATYGPQGALAGFVSGQSNGFNGIANTIVYDIRLQPCRITASSAGASPTECDNNFGNLLDLRYKYDLWIGDNGNVSQVINYRDQSRNQIFTYDALNRLSSAQNMGTDCTVPVLEGKTKFWGNTYTYDAWGNLVGKTPTQCVAENLSVTASVKNQFQAPYTYDSAGNMIHDATANADYVYDPENRIMGAGGITYTYDADGNRVEKSNGTTGTLYWYMSPGIVGESDLAGNLKSEYIFFNGERVARRDFPGNAVFYYFSDHLRTASVITDSVGTILSESDYYPWGGELKFTNNDSNHYKFTGKERDAESGLDYFGARYYSNGLGRFISADWSATPVPVPYADYFNPQTLNLYRYPSNPETYADMNGHQEGDSFNLSMVNPRDLGGPCFENGRCIIEGPPPQQQGSSKPTPKNQPIDPVPVGPDGKPSPPPVPVPDCPNCKWVWVPDAQNTRGGQWKPDAFPKTPGGIPDASWDPGSRGGPGHWDVDDGKGNRTRHYPDGRKMPDNVAHPPGWRPVFSTRNVIIGAGAVGGGYLLYRAIRMLPSLVIPPLWPTIPANAVIP